MKHFFDSASRYNINELIEDVLEICYGDPDNLLLNQALAALYTNCNRHNEAMALYLKLQHHEVSASLY